MKLNIVNSNIDEATQLYTGTLKIKGIEVGTISKQGDALPTITVTNPQGQQLVEEAITYYSHQLLPFSYEGALTLEKLLGHFMDLNLQRVRERGPYPETYDDILPKASAHGLVVGIPNEQFICHELIMPIADALSTPTGRLGLINELKILAPSLHGSNQLLNRNIPLDVLEEAGLKPYQHTLSLTTGVSKTEKQRPTRNHRRGI